MGSWHKYDIPEGRNMLWARPREKEGLLPWREKLFIIRDFECRKIRRNGTKGQQNKEKDGQEN